MSEDHVYLLVRKVNLLYARGCRRTEVIGAYRSRVDAECEMERQQHRYDVRKACRREDCRAEYDIERVELHG